MKNNTNTPTFLNGKINTNKYISKSVEDKE